ncbi:MAG: hypothetical protein GY832_29565 [Chloroflexi bacterium]|nr:hypothetical protein [Chloroflexota bacterium]
MDESNNKRAIKPENGMGAGLAIGMGAGIAIGVALDNIAIGVAIGAGIGVVFGSALSQQSKAQAGSEEEMIDDGNDKN